MPLIWIHEGRTDAQTRTCRAGRAVGTLKGDRRVYQEKFIDTYSKFAYAKLYDRKTSLTALNDDLVLPFDEHDVPLCRVPTERGAECCGNAMRHVYELYLAVKNIEHTHTKVKRPRTNATCESFHRTVLDEFYGVAFHPSPTLNADSTSRNRRTRRHVSRSSTDSEARVRVEMRSDQPNCDEQESMKLGHENAELPP